MYFLFCQKRKLTKKKATGPNFFCKLFKKSLIKNIYWGGFTPPNPPETIINWVGINSDQYYLFVFVRKQEIILGSSFFGTSYYFLFSSWSKKLSHFMFLKACMSSVAFGSFVHPSFKKNKMVQLCWTAAFFDFISNFFPKNLK